MESEKLAEAEPGSVPASTDTSVKNRWMSILPLHFAQPGSAVSPLRYTRASGVCWTSCCPFRRQVPMYGRASRPTNYLLMPKGTSLVEEAAGAAAVAEAAWKPDPLFEATPARPGEVRVTG